MSLASRQRSSRVAMSLLVALCLPMLCSAQCSVAVDAGQGTVTVSPCTLSGSYAFDVGAYTTQLASAGSSAARYTVTVNTLTVVVTSDTTLTLSSSGIAFTTPVDIIVGGFEAAKGKVVVSAQLPNRSSVRIENVVTSVVSNSSAECGLAGVCIADGVFGNLQSLVLRNIQCHIVPSAAAPIGHGVHIVGANVTVNKTDFVLQRFNFTFSCAVAGTSAIAVAFPTNLSLTVNSTLLIDGDGTGLMSFHGSAAVASVVGVNFGFLSLADSWVTVRNVSMELVGPTAVGTAPRVTSAVSLLRADTTVLEQSRIALRYFAFEELQRADNFTGGATAVYGVLNAGTLSMSRYASLSVADGNVTMLDCVCPSAAVSVIQIEISSVRDSTISTVSVAFTASSADTGATNRSMVFVGGGASGLPNSTLHVSLCSLRLLLSADSPRTHGVSLVLLYAGLACRANESCRVRLLDSDLTVRRVSSISYLTLVASLGALELHDGSLLQLKRTALDMTSSSLNPASGHSAIGLYVSSPLVVLNSSIVIEDIIMRLANDYGNAIASIVYLAEDATLQDGGALRVLRGAYDCTVAGAAFVGLLAVVGALTLSGDAPVLSIADVEATMRSTNVATTMGISISSVVFPTTRSGPAVGGQVTLSNVTMSTAAVSTFLTRHGAIQVVSFIGNGNATTFNFSSLRLSMSLGSGVSGAASATIASILFANIGQATTDWFPSFNVEESNISCTVQTSLAIAAAVFLRSGGSALRFTDMVFRNTNFTTVGLTTTRGIFVSAPASAMLTGAAISVVGCSVSVDVSHSSASGLGLALTPSLALTGTGTPLSLQNNTVSSFAPQSVASVTTFMYGFSFVGLDLSFGALQFSGNTISLNGKPSQVGFCASSQVTVSSGGVSFFGNRFDLVDSALAVASGVYFMNVVRLATTTAFDFSSNHIRITSVNTGSTSVYVGLRFDGGVSFSGQSFDLSNNNITVLLTGSKAFAATGVAAALVTIETNAVFPSKPVIRMSHNTLNASIVNSPTANPTVRGLQLNIVRATDNFALQVAFNTFLADSEVANSVCQGASVTILPSGVFANNVLPQLNISDNYFEGSSPNSIHGIRFLAGSNTGKSMATPLAIERNTMSLLGRASAGNVFVGVLLADLQADHSDAIVRLSDNILRLENGKVTTGITLNHGNLGNVFNLVVENNVLLIIPSTAATQMYGLYSSTSLPSTPNQMRLRITGNNFTVVCPSTQQISTVSAVYVFRASIIVSSTIVISGNVFDGWVGGTGAETPSQAAMGSIVRLTAAGSLSFLSSTFVEISNNSFVRPRRLCLVTLSVSPVVADESHFNISGNTVREGVSLIAALGANGLTVQSRSSVVLRDSVALNSNTKYMTYILSSFKIDNASLVASAKLSFATTTISTAAFQFSGAVSVTRGSVLLLSNNTMLVVPSVSMVVMASTLSIGDMCSVLIVNNNGSSISAPTSSMPMLSLGAATATVTSSAVVGVRGNLWDPNFAPLVLYSTSSSLSLDRLRPRAVLIVKFGCNYLGSPLAVISDSAYTSATAIPTSAANIATYVDCGQCDVDLDCFGPNTLSVERVDGQCVCTCVQDSSAQTSTTDFLQCAPPLRRLLTKSAAPSLTISSPTSLSVTNSPSTPSSCSTTTSLSGSESTTFSNSATSSVSLSSSYSSSHSSTVSHSSSVSVTRTPPPTFTKHATSTNTSTKSPRTHSASPAPSGSLSPTVSSTPTLKMSPTSSHAATASVETSRSRPRSISASRLSTNTAALLPTVSHATSTQSISDSASHSGAESATLRENTTQSSSVSQSHSLNPCTMPWAGSFADLIESVVSTASVTLPQNATAGVFDITGTSSYDALSGSRGATINITLRPPHRWRVSATGRPAVATSVSSPVTTTVTASGNRTLTIVVGAPTYNKFLPARRISVTIDAASFYCAAKAATLRVDILISPSPVAVSAVTVQTMTSVASSLSVATANPTAGAAAARVSMLQNLLSCTVDLTEDNGNSFTGYYFGPVQGQYSRGAVVGNIAFLMTVAGSIVLVSAAAGAYGRIARHKPFAEGLVLVLDVLHFPSVLIIPLAVVLQPTLTEATSLFVHQPADGDRLVGFMGFAAMMAVVLPFTYVLVFDFRCSIAKRTAENLSKRNAKMEKSFARWAFVDNSVVDKGAIECMEEGQQPAGGALDNNRRFTIKRIIQAVFEEDDHWVITNPTQTDKRWKRRFLLLFGDYSVRWYSILELWTSVSLGIIAGFNVGVQSVCIGQLFTVVFGYSVLFLCCAVFRPAFGRFGKVYVLLVNALGVVGATSTLVGSWANNAAAVNISTLSAMLIGAVSMIKTLPDLLLLAVALPAIVASIVQPFRESSELHLHREAEEREMEQRRRLLLARANEPSGLLQEDGGCGAWSPRDRLGRDGGEAESAAYGTPPQRHDTMPVESAHIGSYVYNRRVVCDILDSTHFDMRCMVVEMVEAAMPLSHRDMRVLVKWLVEHALTGGPGRLAAQSIVLDVIVPRIPVYIDVKSIVRDIVKGAVLQAERARIGTEGLDDLVMPSVIEQQHVEGRTQFLTSAAETHSAAGGLFSVLERTNRATLGAMSQAVPARMRSGSRRVPGRGGGAPKPPTRRQSSSSSSTSSRSSSSSDVSL